MAFADPQSVTVNAVAKSMPRQGSASPGTLGRFSTADGEYELSVRQNQTANRFRREVRLTHKKVAADPISAVNKEVSASVIIVIDEPKWGFTDAELAFDSAGFITWYSASSYAKQTQLLGGEL
jgi:predicted transglutaminase-like cysteine proteinase